MDQKRAVQTKKSDNVQRSNEQNDAKARSAPAKNGVKGTKNDAQIAQKENVPRVPQATAEQMRMAQMLQGNTGSDDRLHELIKKVVELTGCSSDDAVIALHDTGNDIEAAVNLLLEGGADKNEWTETVKKSKKQKSKKDADQSEDLPYGMASKSGRGRPSQRGRGGRPVAPSAPRPMAARDEGFNGARQNDRERTSQSEARPPNAGNAAAARSDQEGTWDDEIDDWKEALRETKVFERSSAPSGPGSTVPQMMQQQGQSSVSGGGQSFSSIVQKPTAWSAVAAQSTANNAPEATWRPAQPGSTQARPPGYPANQEGAAAPSKPGGHLQQNFPSMPEQKLDPGVISGMSGLTVQNRGAETTNHQQQQSHRAAFGSAPRTSEFTGVPKPQMEVTRTVEPTVNEEIPAQGPSPIAGGSFSLSQSHTFTNSRQGDIGSMPHRAELAPPTQQISPSKSPVQPPVEASSNLYGVAASSQYEAPSQQAPDTRFGSIPPKSVGNLSHPSRMDAGMQFTSSRQTVSTSTSTHYPSSAQTQAAPQQQHFQPPLQQQASPTSKGVGTGPVATSAYGGYSTVAPAATMATETQQQRSFAGGYQAPSTQPIKEPTAAVGQHQQAASQTSGQQNLSAFSPQKSQSTSTSVFTSPSKSLSSASADLAAPKPVYGSQVVPGAQQTASSQQQHYMPQQQQQTMYGQQNMLPFGMYYEDPNNVLQAGTNLNYGYGTSSLGRDPAGNMTYTSVDSSKYRSDNSLAQQVPISQQAAFVPSHVGGYSFMNYQSPVPGAFQQYGTPTAMFQTIPTQYSKPGDTLQNSFPSNYGNLPGLADINKTTYPGTGLRGPQAESFSSGAGIMGTAPDLQSPYFTGKQANKFEKQQGYGFANQQPSYGGNQYGYPVMPQPHMPSMQTGSSNAGNANKQQQQSKQFYHQWNQ